MLNLQGLSSEPSREGEVQGSLVWDSQDLSCLFLLLLLTLLSVLWAWELSSSVSSFQATFPIQGAPYSSKVRATPKPVCVKENGASETAIKWSVHLANREPQLHAEVFGPEK